ncbi:MAG: T9SS type A sorting domain-containing protein, partial [Bacteroidales bacterium]
ARFDVETPGYYYIAFHCLSPKTTHNIAQLYIDDLSIRVAVDVEEPQNIDVMVFPNPANADIQIQANYTINKVDVYNLLGQKVLSQHYNTKYATLQVSDLTEGLYIVKVNTDNGEIVSKVTVSH